MMETNTRKIRPGGRATIRDIARIAGVSVATVSRVINGRPDVSTETRNEVLRVMRAENFSTNRSARALSVGRTGLIGFTVPFVDENYFTMILSGAAEALYEQEQRVVLCPTHHQHDREVTLLERLMNGTTDGAIILLPEESSEELRKLQEFGYPFVVADPRQPLDEGIPADLGQSLRRRRGRLSTTCSTLGHRRIGAHHAAPGAGRRPRSASRDTGRRSRPAGSRSRPSSSSRVHFNTETGYAAARRLLDLPQPPTAIFASNDNMAVGAMRAVLERGLRVPDDFSIVGFDDTELARAVIPRLTTVRQPLAELGRTAVSLLNRLIDGQRIEALRIELVDETGRQGVERPGRGLSAGGVRRATAISTTRLASTSSCGPTRRCPGSTTSAATATSGWSRTRQAATRSTVTPVSGA